MKFPLSLCVFIGGVCLLSQLLSGAESAFSIPAPGLQLYSLRTQFKTDVPGTLRSIAKLGYREVETAGTYGMAPKDFSELLAHHGLKAVSGHFPFEQLEKSPDQAAEEAKTLGLIYAGCAWIPHAGAFSAADASHAIAVFNRAGEAFAKRGIRFFYHCHGYEFKAQKEGTLMDTIMQGCDPKLVEFEMDVLWLYLPGQDPIEWMRRYPGRWTLLHVKDVKPGVARGTESTDQNNEVPLGKGQMDWRAIINVARETKVERLIIEDESDAAPMQIGESYQYINGLLK